MPTNTLSSWCLLTTLSNHSWRWSKGCFVVDLVDDDSMKEEIWKRTLKKTYTCLIFIQMELWVGCRFISSDLLLSRVFLLKCLIFFSENSFANNTFFYCAWMLFWWWWFGLAWFGVVSVWSVSVVCLVWWCVGVVIGGCSDEIGLIGLG